MKKRFFLLINRLIFILFILSATGCWSHYELPSLGIVMGMGIDKSQDLGNIQLTAQVVKPSVIKSGKGPKGSSGSDDKAYWNIINTGSTVSEAIEGFNYQLGKKIYFPHNQIIILGYDLAKEGVQKDINFFLREPSIRLSNWLLVSREKASTVLDISPQVEKLQAINLTKLVESQATASQSVAVNLEDFLTCLMSETTAPVAPLIEISGKGEDRTVKISETAVFKQDKLVGQLDNSETRGLLWVLNKVKGGVIVVNYPDSSSKVSLLINHAKSKMIPFIENDTVHIRLEINTEGTIESQSSPGDLTLPTTIAALETEESNVIRNEIIAAIRKAVKLKADIFGFGDAIHQRYPKQWKDLLNKWDEVFSEIEVDINVNTRLISSGRIGDIPAISK
jgi:spore germination protein KC